MRVRVKLFAVAKEIAGSEELDVEVPSKATIADIRAAVETSFPALARVLPHAMWAVDAQYAPDDVIVQERSDVAIIPPVSGG